MMHLRRKLAMVGVALFAGSLAATPVFAWSDDLAGRPDNLEPGGTAGYYVWHDDGGLHIATTDPDGCHRFTARIETNGEFTDVDPVRLETRDDIAILDGGHTMELRFVTCGWIDGVNFHIDGGSGMRLALRIDGLLAPTDRVFLGEDASHPDSNPFVELR